MSSDNSNGQTPRSEQDRREFLKGCGCFAAFTPPAVTMLLSTSLTSNAIASSGSGGGGSGGGSTRIRIPETGIRGA